MKQAIWKIAPFGDFAFRGTQSDQQLTIDFSNPNFNPLKNALIQYFRGKGWITIKEALDYVASDRTDYHTGQVKTNALKPMEKDGQIEVREQSRKRKFTYPEGTWLRFL